MSTTLRDVSGRASYGGSMSRRWSVSTSGIWNNNRELIFRELEFLPEDLWGGCQEGSMLIRSLNIGFYNLGCEDFPFSCNIDVGLWNVFQLRFGHKLNNYDLSHLILVALAVYLATQFSSVICPLIIRQSFLVQWTELWKFNTHRKPGLENTYLCFD